MTHPLANIMIFPQLSLYPHIFRPLPWSPIKTPKHPKELFMILKSKGKELWKTNTIYTKIFLTNQFNLEWCQFSLFSKPRWFFPIHKPKAPFYKQRKNVNAGRVICGKISSQLKQLILYCVMCTDFSDQQMLLDFVMFVI